jgi:hypothetical protein
VIKRLREKLQNSRRVSQGDEFFFHHGVKIRRGARVVLPPDV